MFSFDWTRYSHKGKQLMNIQLSQLNMSCPKIQGKEVRGLSGFPRKRNGHVTSTVSEICFCYLKERILKHKTMIL